MQPDPLVCSEDEALVGLAARMRSGGASVAVIVDRTGIAIGALDEEFLRRTGSEARADEPVRSALGLRPPPLINLDLPVYVALSRMEREGLPTMVVVDGNGLPHGVLHADKILKHPMAGLLAILGRMRVGDDIASLAGMKHNQGEVVAALLERHESAIGTLEFINASNFDIARRLAKETVATLAAEGWGAPPVPFTLILMGSAGRGESLLHPDQDNGFILADYPDADHTRIDGYFIALAERLTRDLATVGFPLCKGGVMASNPLWRKTLSQWRDQVTGWTLKRSNVAILFADIFFDFRPAYGPPEFAADLRRHVTRTIRGNLPFLNQMAWRQVEQSVAIGRFGRLFGDSIDIKLNAMLPLVELVRLLALKNGIDETGTLARLGALRQAGIIVPDDHAGLAEAFGFLIELQLRRQLADAAAGRETGTEFALSALSRRQRDLLSESLRSIEGFRRDVTGDAFGTAGYTGAE